jgi:hypothetical protein
MDIAGISSISSGSGLQATSTAINKAQDQFNDTATKLVNDTVSGDVGSPEVSDAAALQTESLQNQLLYSVFNRQAEQQKATMDMLGAGTRG